MKNRRLGKSGIMVSEICLGTMTYGSQCDEALSVEILNHAYDAGVDFYDVAEIYPVPPDEKWVGASEEIVGRWMKDRPRESVIVATKVAGPGHGWFKPPVRSGKTALDRAQIMRAIEGSLKRLQTDYIDLYQVHWPDHDMRYEDMLEPLTDLVDQGKVRAIGCSNETAWGLTKSLWTADAEGLARFDTIQNNFSLNNRRFEDELAQVCRQESVSLLPYSPIAGGVLSGKYNGGKKPAAARFTKYMEEGMPRQTTMAGRFVNERSLAATERFMHIAEEAELHPVTMAVAWSKQHDYVASTIIGANSVAQLEESLQAADLKLDEATLEKINTVSEEILYPMG